MLSGAQLFTLEPRDTLLVRDGRAMNAGVARSLPFPPPSTLAGVVRTRLGLDAKGHFQKERARELRETVSIHGPLLARLAERGDGGDRVPALFAPAPGDCVWFADGKDAWTGRRLVPRPTSAIAGGAMTDLGAEADLVDFAVDPPSEKPARGPAFWSWASLLEWLERPRDGLAQADVDGLGAFPTEIRTHVAIDPATGTAADGALFGIESVRLTRSRSVTLEGGRSHLAFDRFAVLGGWSGPGKLAGGLVPLGGERVAAFLEVLAPGAFPSLARPSWLGSLQPGKRARVVLLTPALFSKGSFPETLAGARVVAAKVGPPEVVSGWSFESNCPKPTRRTAPAGSVYWVEVPSEGWARDTWLTPVSDDGQDRRDGFGLAVVGVA